VPRVLKRPEGLLIYRDTEEDKTREEKTCGPGVRSGRLPQKMFKVVLRDAYDAGEL